MTDLRIRTPVIFLIFRRPHTTARVFAEIARARPPKLLVVADGPHADRPGEAEKCAAARAIIEQVDWPCEVLTNYAETNMGCKNRVASGLTWAFDHVEEAIILEDDCLPHPTFFRYCEELLERYRYDERIMAICGTNFQLGHQRSDDSYYFSIYNDFVGWATWKRAWQHYDHEMRLWPIIRDNNWLFDLHQDLYATQYWTNLFNLTYENRINTWGYRWRFACWREGGLSIVPNINLVSHIGAGPDAVNHRSTEGAFENRPVEAMPFPMDHPPHRIRDVVSDRITNINRFGIRPPSRAEKLRRILRLPKRVFRYSMNCIWTGNYQALFAAYSSKVDGVLARLQIKGLK
jgi:hypothetical protein